MISHTSATHMCVENGCISNMTTPEAMYLTCCIFICEMQFITDLAAI